MLSQNNNEYRKKGDVALNRSGVEPGQLDAGEAHEGNWG